MGRHNLGNINRKHNLETTSRKIQIWEIQVGKYTSDNTVRKIQHGNYNSKTEVWKLQVEQIQTGKQNKINYQLEK